MAPVISAVGMTGNTAPARPVLRWYGGKWRIADWLIALMPQHGAYVEPFAGSFSVGMRKPRVPVEVLNDRDERLVNVFRVLRDPVQADRLYALLKLTPYSFCEYMQARERSNDPVEDARRMLVLGAQSHGASGAAGGKLSGWRRGNREAQGKKGSGGAANSYAREWANLHGQVQAWVDRLAGVYIECDEALSIVGRWDAPDTLFYVDPPYLHSTRIGARSVYRHEMTDADHVQLAERLKACHAMVMVSGYPSALYEDLYAGWQRYDCATRADNNARRTECVWLNAAAVAAQPQPGLFDG